jgi:hypothetical protein
MPLGDVETFYEDGAWHNRITGSDEVFGTADTRGSAVWAGRSRARRDRVAHTIRGADGQTLQRSDYAAQR